MNTFPDLREQVSRKEKHSSPLEEWAKATWFSKESPTKQVEEDLEKMTVNDFDQVTDGQSQLLTRKGSFSDQADSMNVTAITSENIISPDELSKKKLSNDPVNPISSGTKSAGLPYHRLAPSDNTNLSDNSMPGTLTPPALTNLDRSEVDLSDSSDQKLRRVNSSGISAIDQTVLKEANAREQAFLDWNVKKTDDMYRPPLSRQQSQQQLEQVKQQIQEATKAEDRDRALREWNVFESITDSPSPLKSLSKTSGDNVLTDKINAVPSVSGLVQEKKPCNSQLSTQGSNFFVEGCDSRSYSADLKATNMDLQSKLAEEVERMKMEYQTQLKVKQQELKLKFEMDKEAIVKMYQEELQRSIEEESKTNEIKFKEIISQLEREADSRMKQLKEQLEHKQNCASQQILEQHQQALAAQEVENQAAMFRIREQHSADMKTLREQFQREVIYSGNLHSLELGRVLASSLVHSEVYYVHLKCCRKNKLVVNTMIELLVQEKTVMGNVRKK